MPGGARAGGGVFDERDMMMPGCCVFGDEVWRGVGEGDSVRDRVIMWSFVDCCLEYRDEGRGRDRDGWMDGWMGWDGMYGNNMGT